MLGPKRFALVWASAVACALVVSAARADEAATADALFRAGRSAMQRGDYADAAGRFAESFRVDPAPGTLLNLALAEENLGRLSAAWEHARSAADQLPSKDERQRVARDLFAKLDKRVPRVVLRARDLPDGTHVRLDGVELRSASFGLPLPVDPGNHVVSIDAPGHVERVLRLDAVESRTLESNLEAGPTVLAEVSSPAPRRETRAGGSGLRTAGWIGVGVGVGAAVAGGVFGALAIDRNGVVEDRCSGHFCDDEGTAAAKDGRTFAAVSTGMFIGAGVFVLAGAALLVLSPTGPSATRSAAIRF